MAHKEKSTSSITDLAERFQSGGFNKYVKPISIIGIIIILLSGVYIGYKQFVLKPREVAANEAIFGAENLFDKMASTSFTRDSSIVVLNGGNIEDQNITGVLKVINKFGSTGAGNRARYIAGATYLHLKDFDKAIKYLKDFKGGKATQVQSAAYILLGHAYAEKNNASEALNYYKKASTVNKEDKPTTSNALYIAALFADAQGKSSDAKALFDELKNGYPDFQPVRSGEIDKYLARLGELK